MRSLPLRAVPVCALLLGMRWGNPVPAPEQWVPAKRAPELGPAAAVEGDPCLALGPTARWTEPACARLRRVFVDLDALDLPARRGGRMLQYDLQMVTRPLSPEELALEDELSVAVRLILSEVGADRLLDSRLGWIEAVGILATVDHRLDPAFHDPEERPESPDFPGCGREGTFASCADPVEYLGMQTWRALDPGKGYPPDLLEAAADRAVLSWYLWRSGLVEDPTGGAVSYVHRCGGAAYGEPTWRCDGHMGRPRGDIPGANPHTGPIVFRAPAAWRQNKGWYSLSTAEIVHYEPWSHADEMEALDDLDAAALLGLEDD